MSNSPTTEEVHYVKHYRTNAVTLLVGHKKIQCCGALLISTSGHDK
jgi:hypothetical protein